MIRAYRSGLESHKICSIADPLEVSIPNFYQELVLVIQLD